MAPRKKSAIRTRCNAGHRLPWQTFLDYGKIATSMARLTQRVARAIAERGAFRSGGAAFAIGPPDSTGSPPHTPHHHLERQ